MEASQDLVVMNVAQSDLKSISNSLDEKHLEGKSWNFLQIVLAFSKLVNLNKLCRRSALHCLIVLLLPS